MITLDGCISEISPNPNRGRPLKWFDFQDKKNRNIGFNFDESSILRGICKLSSEQIGECYKYETRPLSDVDIAYLCRGCQYTCQAAKIYGDLCGSIFEPYYLCDREEISKAANPKCFVYLIHDSRYVKIGMAKDVTKRLAGLQTGNAEKLSILCVIPCKSESSAGSLESYMHSIYRQYALEGEWFNILDKLDLKEWSASEWWA